VRCYYRGMRAALPFVLIALAIFSAACVAYIAWELTSDKKKPSSDDQ